MPATSHFQRTLHGLLTEEVDFGISYAVQYADARKRTYGNAPPQFAIILKDDHAAERFLFGGSLGFGTAYMDHHIDVQGDLQAFFHLRHRMKRRLSMTPSLFALSVRHFIGKRASRNRATEIAHHYDLGNRFFSSFLDEETMCYSCAYFLERTEPLAAAQQNKMENILEKLDVSSGSRLYDIGSGWGGLSILAAQRGIDVDAVTYSRAQNAYAQDWAHRERLPGARFRYGNMLTMKTAMHYDAIACIEMIEHMGKDDLRDFFIRVHALLRQGGRFVLQASVRDAPKPTDRFTATHIFPGGYFPAKSEIMESAERAGFLLENEEMRRSQYVRTLQHWITRFADARPDIEKDFGMRFSRMWWLWLNGAKVSFETESLDCVQYTFVKT